MLTPIIKIVAVNRFGVEGKTQTFRHTFKAREAMDRILDHGQTVNVYIDGKLTNTWKPTCYCVLAFTSNAPQIVARKYVGFTLSEADAAEARWREMGFSVKRSQYTQE